MKGVLSEGVLSARSEEKRCPCHLRLHVLLIVQ